MKITSNALVSFNPTSNKAIRGILVYGSDQGLVSEYGGKLSGFFDPFSLISFSSDDLKKNPERFLDEALSLGFFGGGGRRCLKVSSPSDGFIKLLETYLQSRSDAFLVILADSLPKSSALRVLFETSSDLYCLPCYPDEGPALQALIKNRFKEAGIAVDPDALLLLASRLGGDRLMTQSEIDKLILYLDDRKHLSAEDVLDVSDDVSALSFDLLLQAVMEGQTDKVQSLLSSLYQEGENPVRLIRLFQMHFMRLSEALSDIASGQSVDGIVAGLRPPLFFKAADSFKRQLRLWTLTAARRAQERLIQTEIDCKTTGLPAETVLAQTLLLLSSFPAKRRQGS